MRWLAETELEGEVAARIGRDGDRFVAEWVGLGRLTVQRDGSDANLAIEEGVDPARVDKLRNGSVRALVRQLRGELSLHAGAIALDDEGLVFLGESGAGKSTFIAACCERGATFFADDVIAIDPPASAPVITRLETHHWLVRESVEALGLASDAPDSDPADLKYPVEAERLAVGSAPLSAIVHLAFGGDAPRLERLGAADAAGVIIPQVVRFVIDEPEVQRRELDSIFELVQRVPIYRLVRPRDTRLLLSTVALLSEVVR